MAGFGDESTVSPLCLLAVPMDLPYNKLAFSFRTDKYFTYCRFILRGGIVKNQIVFLSACSVLGKGFSLSAVAGAPRNHCTWVTEDYHVQPHKICKWGIHGALPYGGWSRCESTFSAAKSGRISVFLFAASSTTDATRPEHDKPG
jgi:hypothetical protein